VTYDAIYGLAYPADSPSRANWSVAHLADIARFEGVPLTVTGYLSHAIRVEGKEYCNCRYTVATEVDWHLYLTKQPEQQISQAIVIETTPRVRASHPAWTVDKLTPWLDGTDPVRISGWLMLDPEHANQVGQFRGTIWEIHPITKIEVWKNGGWVDLEALP
jgi:hypothetical protein